jgi:hypothetical protein
VLTGEYGGKAGFRHVMDGIGIAVVPADEDLVFHLVRLVNAMTGYSLTEDELRLIATCPRSWPYCSPTYLLLERPDRFAGLGCFQYRQLVDRLGFHGCRERAPP